MCKEKIPWKDHEIIANPRIILLTIFKISPDVSFSWNSISRLWVATNGRWANLRLSPSARPPNFFFCLLLPTKMRANSIPVITKTVMDLRGESDEGGHPVNGNMSIVETRLSGEGQGSIGCMELEGRVWKMRERRLLGVEWCFQNRTPSQAWQNSKVHCLKPVAKWWPGGQCQPKMIPCKLGYLPVEVLLQIWLTIAQGF